MITSKAFSSITRLASNYGFQNISGAVIGSVTATNLNQPATNTTYDVNYSYLAPKENERITVTFNYNNLIDSATTTIEQVRPITADVLIKAAKQKVVDFTAKIVLMSQYTSQEQTVLENATDAVTSFLNASSLATTIDASDIVNKLYSVAGIDRVRVILFGEPGLGNELSVTAGRNEYLKAGTVTITTETR
jgi:hypothetical protein